MWRILLSASLAIFLLASCGGDSDTSEVQVAGDETPASDTTPADSEHDSAAGDDDENGADEPVSFADYLSNGVCFNDQFDEEGDYLYSSPPPIVDCSEPHDNEVVLVEEFPAGADDPFPGYDAFDDFFDDVCVPAFDEFLGISDPPRALDGYYLEPLEDEWDAGARNIACVIYLPDAQLRGSVEGLGHDIFPANFPEDMPLPAGIVLSSAASTEDSYAPSDGFAEEAGFDIDGLFGATFEGGPIQDAKDDLRSVILADGWAIQHEDDWERFDTGTAFYALEKDGRRIIVEVWELEGGNSRFHYFYHPQ